LRMPMLFSKHENRMSPAQVRLGAGSVVHHSKSDRSMSVQGHQLPRRLLVRAAAMASITDTKAVDGGGYRATRHSLSR